jgi:hypothetical protein
MRPQDMQSLEGGIFKVFDRLCVNVHGPVAEGSGFSKARQNVPRTEIFLQFPFIDNLGIANNTCTIKFG